VSGPVDTDDECESAAATGNHSGVGVLDDDRALRTHTESAGGLQKVHGVAVDRKPELAGDGAVDADIEQVINPGGFQDLLTVTAR
jgi:hypothetical protein